MWKIPYETMVLYIEDLLIFLLVLVLVLVVPFVILILSFVLILILILFDSYCWCWTLSRVRWHRNRCRGSYRNLDRAWRGDCGKEWDIKL